MGRVEFKSVLVNDLTLPTLTQGQVSCEWGVVGSLGELTAVSYLPALPPLGVSRGQQANRAVKGELFALFVLFSFRNYSCRPLLAVSPAFSEMAINNPLSSAASLFVVYVGLDECLGHTFLPRFEPSAESEGLSPASSRLLVLCK